MRFTDYSEDWDFWVLEFVFIEFGWELVWVWFVVWLFEPRDAAATVAAAVGVVIEFAVDSELMPLCKSDASLETQLSFCFFWFRFPLLFDMVPF